MCLYPLRLKNKKYITNQKNGGVVPECKDKRTLEVLANCGNCIECVKEKKRE